MFRLTRHDFNQKRRGRNQKLEFGFVLFCFVLFCFENKSKLSWVSLVPKRLLAKRMQSGPDMCKLVYCSELINRLSSSAQQSWLLPQTPSACGKVPLVLLPPNLLLLDRPVPQIENESCWFLHFYISIELRIVFQIYLSFHSSFNSFFLMLLLSWNQAVLSKILVVILDF